MTQSTNLDGNMGGQQDFIDLTVSGESYKSSKSTGTFEVVDLTANSPPTSPELPTNATNDAGGPPPSKRRRMQPASEEAKNSFEAKLASQGTIDHSKGKVRKNSGEGSNRADSAPAVVEDADLKKSSTSELHPELAKLSPERSVSFKDPIKIEKEGGLDLLFFKPFLKAPGRQDWFEYLRNELSWYRVSYATRGINVVTPRFTTVFGIDDTGTSPSSSLYKITPRPIPEALKLLKGLVEACTKAEYNFVLVNYYKDGSDSITWHSDDESFLGSLPTIASLTLGGPRDFMMKHKTLKELPTEKWHLTSGDMIVMQGTTQSQWLHTVPKRKSAEGRINITFRRAKVVAGTNNYYKYNVGTGPIFRWKKGEMVQVS